MNLREKVVKSSIYLVSRQGLGTLVSLAGIILLTRAIGPANYGLYVSALAIVIYLSYFSGLSINIYLIRKETAPGVSDYYQAFTLLFFTGIAGIALGLASIPLLKYWFQNPAFIPPLFVMLFSLLFTVLAAPASAKLERDLNYRAVAVIEFAGQVLNYTAALFLAYQGMGVWAPVTGYVLWQAFVFIAACSFAKLYPRFYWSRDSAKEMLKYGFSFSCSIWVWQLRTLVNPLITGRYAGPEAVGYIALAIRLIEALSFVKTAVSRLSIAVFAKLQEDRERLKLALESAMSLQVLALGILLSLFACIAPAAVPALFGTEWTVVLDIYPFIAVGCLVNAVFNTHSSVLYVLNRNWDVVLFHLVHTGLFVSGALCFLPRFGLLGYGFAEIAAVLSYIFIHVKLTRVFNPDYMKALPWLAAFLVPLWSVYIDFPERLLLFLTLPAVFIIPVFRKTMIDSIKLLKVRG